MEILSPGFLQIAERVALFATLLSAATLAICIGVRWSFDLKTRRTARFRHEAEPLVTSYLAERTPAGDVSALLGADPERALLLLMEISDRLEPADRARLRPLFAALPLAESEAANLRSRRWETRLRAAERLGYLGDSSLAPALREALNDDVLTVRFAAARSLRALDGTESIEPILRAFDLPGEMNQRRVAEILFDFGPAAIDPLLAVAADREGRYSDNVVDVAVRVLGMLRAAKASPVLLPLLQSPEFRVRLNAVRALGQIGDHAAVPDISRLATDPAWEVRNAAVQALGHVQANGQQGVLVTALADQSWWVRHSAASALQGLGDRGIDALREVMRNSPDRFARDISRQILEEQRLLDTKEKLS